MWKASVLCVTLLFTFINVHAEEHKEKSNTPDKEQDLNKDTGDIDVTPDLSNARPRDLGEQSLPKEFSPLLGYRLLSSADLKRGRNFGFVGSRGRRGETLGDALFGEEFPVRRPAGESSRLRMLLGTHHQGMISKDKRKPHFGFHGSRG